MKAITISASLIYLLATTSAVSAYLPQPPRFHVGPVHRRDGLAQGRKFARQEADAHRLERKGTGHQRRAPIPEPQVVSLPGSGEDPTPTGNDTSPTSSQGTTSQDTGGGGGNGPTTTSTPPPTTTTPPPAPPTTTTPTTTEQPPTTTTSDTPATSSTITTTVNTAVTTTAAQGTTIARTSSNTYRGSTLTATYGTLSRSSTSSSATSTETGSGSTPFMQNKGAVAATAVVVSLVAVGALVFVGFWLKKKNQRGKLGDDTWDEASMKEFPPAGHAGNNDMFAPVVPPPLMRSASNGAALGRSNTILPSQSAGASPLARTKSHSARSHEDDVYSHSDEPDEMLAMPPVKNYERPRDSAFDIVPAAPPAAMTAHNNGYSPTAFSPGGYNYYEGGGYASPSAAAVAGGSGSGGLEPPKRKGTHTSFGSGVGNDPFAGSGFVDATRESTFGPGQAGRGAGGYNINAYGGEEESAYEGNAVAGPSRSNYQQQPQQQQQPNHWAQGYNPYAGYGQASGSGNGGYGGYGYAN